MTHRTDEAPRREVIARWCTLAEQRLDYLTEMFESGRWRRFYTEVAFLDNIKEAKFAVDTWRNLLNPRPARPVTPELVQGVAAVALALSESAVPVAMRPPEPDPAPIAPETLELVEHEIAADEPEHDVVEEAEFAPSEAVPPEPIIDMLALERALDIPDAAFDMTAIEQRYPLLRNAL